MPIWSFCHGQRRGLPLWICQSGSNALGFRIPAVFTPPMFVRHCAKRHSCAQCPRASLTHVKDLVEASHARAPRHYYPWLTGCGGCPGLADFPQTLAMERSSGPRHAHRGLRGHLFLVGRCGELPANRRTSGRCALVDAGLPRRTVPIAAAVFPALVLAADHCGDASLRVVRCTSPPS